MHEDQIVMQEQMFNAGYRDGLEDHTPHPNPSEPAWYGRGYDAGFFTRHGMSWEHVIGEES